MPVNRIKGALAPAKTTDRCPYSFFAISILMNVTQFSIEPLGLVLATMFSKPGIGTSTGADVAL